MKRKNILLLSIFCIALVIVGLGASTIYSSYFYLHQEYLTSIYVDDPSTPWRPGMPELTEEESNQKMFSFMQSLDEWANAHKATVIFEGDKPDSLLTSSVAGCGYCDYSGYFTSVFNDYECDVAKNSGIYIREDVAFKDAYVKDGILMPRTLKLKVSGTYSDNDVPSWLASRDFFYPITISTVAEGAYFTDSKDVDSLIHFFEENGYKILHYNLNEPISLSELMRQIRRDGDTTLAVLSGMIGLVIFLIYNTMLLYRENLRSLQIRHIFGLSKKRMLFTSIGIALLVSAISIGLFSIVMFYAFYFSHISTLMDMLFYVSIGITSISLATSMVYAISVTNSVTKVR